VLWATSETFEWVPTLVRASARDRVRNTIQRADVDAWVRRTLVGGRGIFKNGAEVAVVIITAAAARVRREHVAGKQRRE
jgi:hypothetical protein